MKTMTRLTLIMLLLLLSVGCGGTSGSATGGSISCSGTSGGASCTGRYSKISGTVSQDIETSGNADSVDVEATLSVESGSVRLYVRGEDDVESSAQATPGQPASLAGVAEVSFDEFSVYFQALDGPATGLTYSIEFVER
jgi:hypothetical protein